MPRKKKSQDAAPPLSAAAKVGDLLRHDILACAEGEFLGNEDALMARYGVSRPTFRQSVRMLEQEQLLEVRRGPEGGYYARKPTMQTVGRIAASYLESRNTTPDQLIDAANAAFVSVVQRAAHAHNDTARTALATLNEKLEHTDVAAQPFADYHRDEIEFRAVLAQLANNPALELMIEMLYQAAMDEEEPGPSTFVHKTARREEWKRMRLRMAEAILNREAEIAVALTNRMHEVLFGWRAEDKAAM